MQCIIMENTLIKLTLHDETKKRAHVSQIVRAKEVYWHRKPILRSLTYNRPNSRISYDF